MCEYRKTSVMNSYDHIDNHDDKAINVIAIISKSVYIVLPIYNFFSLFGINMPILLLQKKISKKISNCFFEF